MKEKDYKDEIRESLVEWYQTIIGWFRYDKGSNIFLFLVNLVWKIPLFLIMLALSPVLLIILLFTFIVVA